LRELLLELEPEELLRPVLVEEPLRSKELLLLPLRLKDPEEVLLPLRLKEPLLELLLGRV
jgi:hypothetical protein